MGKFAHDEQLSLYTLKLACEDDALADMRFIIVRLLRSLFVEPTCDKGRQSCYCFAKVFVRASVWIRPGHNFLHLCMDFKII